MCRWIDLIEEMDLTILHRPGIRHGNADGCSRANVVCNQCKLSANSYAKLDDAANSGDVTAKLPTNHCDGQSSNATAVDGAHIRRAKATNNKLCIDFDIAAEQQKDPDIKPVYDALKESTSMPDWKNHLPCSEDTKNLLAQWPLLCFENNILYRRWIDGMKTTRWLQCVIPTSCRQQVLQLAHTGLTGGHYGARKTCAQVNNEHIGRHGGQTASDSYDDVRNVQRIEEAMRRDKANCKICKLVHRLSESAST